MEQFITALIITSPIIFIVYQYYKVTSYASKLEKENIELQKLLALPKHLQFKTINKAWNINSKNQD